MRRSHIYILPNLLTSINILAGMFCIITSISGNNDDLWYAAAVLFIGMVADVFDGILARIQKAASEFGIQYDSLADVISFGVAPAVLAYNLGLSRLPGRVGVGIAFLFTVCAALRLARFNTQATTGAKKSFAGIPSPVAAGFVASACVVLIKHDIIETMLWPLGICVIILSYMMISNVRYPSSADLIIVGKKPFVYLTVPTLAIGCAVFFIEKATFAGFAIYVFYGIIRQIYRFFVPLPELGTELRYRGIRHRPRKRGKFFGRFIPRRKKNNSPDDSSQI